ncbi:MAG: hypothetical protein QOD62_2819, partial [Actinomycetota bacterium]|nr:hypothetical protein [Actinomycetota bacterium]
MAGPRQVGLAGAVEIGGELDIGRQRGRQREEPADLSHELLGRRAVLDDVVDAQLEQTLLTGGLFRVVHAQDLPPPPPEFQDEATVEEGRDVLGDEHVELLLEADPAVDHPQADPAPT